MTAPGDLRRKEQVRASIERLRQTLPEMATKIENLSWIKDGISTHELWAADGLTDLAVAGYGGNLVDLPWVVEGRIHPALESLSSLAEHNPEILDRIMAHPSVSDGITEQEAKAIAPLEWPIFNPDLQSKLLDPEQVSVQERTITLPLSGETELTIVRTRLGLEATYLMDLLERAVRIVEEYMGAPFPRRQLIFYFEEDYFGGGSWLEGFVSIGDHEQESSEERMLSLLTHEASHYYWNGLTRWINEGAATFMEGVVKNTLQGPTSFTPCTQARSIAELEMLEPDRESSDCPYALGERLFRDLYRNMDETAFRLAFRRLYLHNWFNNTYHVPTSATPVIDQVREAFTTYVSGETAANVEKVIARWHDGTEPYDLTHIEEPVSPELAAIDGRIGQAYLSLSAGGIPVSTVTITPGSIKIIHLNLEYSFQNSNNVDSLPIEVARIYEDGFELQRKRTELPVHAGGTQGTHSVTLLQEASVGQFWVVAYLGGQKIAEATYETPPLPELHAIRGTIRDTQGQSLLSDVSLTAQGAENEFAISGSYVDGPYEIFDILAPQGLYVLEVLVSIPKANYSQLVFVGWYDGEGGITTNPDHAFEFMVVDSDVEGIDLVLPEDTKGLACPSGRDRSRETGRCS